MIITLVEMASSFILASLSCIFFVLDCFIGIFCKRKVVAYILSKKKKTQQRQKITLCFWGAGKSLCIFGRLGKAWSGRGAPACPAQIRGCLPVPEHLWSSGEAGG